MENHFCFSSSLFFFFLTTWSHLFYQTGQIKLRESKQTKPNKNKTTKQAEPVSNFHLTPATCSGPSQSVESSSGLLFELGGNQTSSLHWTWRNKAETRTAAACNQGEPANGAEKEENLTLVTSLRLNQILLKTIYPLFLLFFFFFQKLRYNWCITYQFQLYKITIGYLYVATWLPP